MVIDFPCPQCGRRLRAQPEHRGNSARCPGCNTTCTVPPEEQPQPSDVETLDEVPDHCPSCNASLAPDAVLCIECGFNLRTGRTFKTRIKRFDKKWLAGPPLAARLRRVALFEFFFIPVFLLGIGLGLKQMVLGIVALSLLTVGLVVWIGCISSVRLSRARKGDLTLDLLHYFAFIPAGRRSLKMERYQAILLEYTENWDLIEACWLYFKNAASGSYYEGDTRDHLSYCKVWLKGRRADETVLLYRGYDDAEAREIIEVLQSVTDLPVTR